MREVGHEVGFDRRAPDARRRPAFMHHSLPPPYVIVSEPQQRTGPPPVLDPGRRQPQSFRRGRSNRLSWRVPLAASLVIGAALFAVLTEGGSQARRAPWTLADADALLAWAGFGIDQISVSGHRFTPDGDILDALDLGAALTWRSLDTKAARDRIERLPWVATATLTRHYPGRLDVRLVEREAFGIWQHGARQTLIDRSGRSLSDVGPESAVAGHGSLPRFRGEGAEQGAAAITSTVARHPELARRLTLAERVAGRRWTLHLDTGTALHLPPDREALVLDQLLANPRLRQLIGQRGRVIDLRAPGRIAVRPVSVPASNGGS